MHYIISKFKSSGFFMNTLYLGIFSFLLALGYQSPTQPIANCQFETFEEEIKQFDNK